MSKILMYGTPTCGDCVLAKQVFAEKNIDYDYIDISNDEDATKKSELDATVRVASRELFAMVFFRNCKFGGRRHREAI